MGSKRSAVEKIVDSVAVSTEGAEISPEEVRRQKLALNMANGTITTEEWAELQGLMAKNMEASKIAAEQYGVAFKKSAYTTPAVKKDSKKAIMGTIVLEINNTFLGRYESVQAELTTVEMSAMDALGEACKEKGVAMPKSAGFTANGNADLPGYTFKARGGKGSSEPWAPGAYILNGTDPANDVQKGIVAAFATFHDGYMPCLAEIKRAMGLELTAKIKKDVNIVANEDHKITRALQIARMEA